MTMSIDLPILFPHPLLPRADMTAAEKSFFREALRLLRPYIGDATFSINDADVKGGTYYRLSARWADPTGANHRASGVGPTPGEALRKLIAKVRPA